AATVLNALAILTTPPAIRAALPILMTRLPLTTLISVPRDTPTTAPSVLPTSQPIRPTLLIRPTPKTRQIQPNPVMAMMTATAMVAGAVEVVVTAVAMEAATVRVMERVMERAVALVAAVTAMAKATAKKNSPIRASAVKAAMQR